MAKARTGSGRGVAASVVGTQAMDQRDGREARRYLDALKVLLDSPAGRLVFGDETHGILAQCGLYRDAFVPGDGGHATAYNAGRRAVGIALREQCVAANAAMVTRMESEMRIQRRDDELGRTVDRERAEQSGEDE